MSSETAKLSANDVLMEQILTSKSFRRIDKNSLKTMVQKIEILRVHAGETIFRQGEVGDCFYIIRDGTCRVLTAGADGRMVEAATLGPGDTFGEGSLIVGRPRSATLEMQTDGTLARLNKSDFETLIKNPLLQGVNVEEAKLLLAEGACVIDSRSESEFARYAVPGSRNVQLTDLRRERRGIDRQLLYIAVSDKELEGALAAFLLAQKGMDARYLTAPIAELVRACASDDLDSLTGLGEDNSRVNVIELPEEYLRGGRENMTPIRVSDRAVSANATTVSAHKPESDVDPMLAMRTEYRRLLQEIDSRHRLEIQKLRTKLRGILGQHHNRIAALERRLESQDKGTEAPS